ncbi:MAG: hypothetical protein ACP5VE_00855 [Chthonomonadales bacterium]
MFDGNRYARLSSLAGSSWNVVLVLASAWAAVSPARADRAAPMDFSPDGQRIAYAWVGTPAASLSVVRIDGSALQVVPGGAGGAAPKWSPDGSQLLFAAGDVPNRARIYDIAKGQTHDVGPLIGPPFAWREDGKRLAGLRPLASGGVEIVWYLVADAGTTFRVPLTFQPVQRGPLIWLPNTDDAAMLGQSATGVDVYTVEAGQIHQITTSSDVLGLALSADRSSLVWARKSPNTRYILMSAYRFDLKSRSSVRLSFPDRVKALNPDPHHAPRSVDWVEFSPDGSRLLMWVTLDVKPVNKVVRALYTVTMDGRSAQLLARSAPQDAVGPAAAPAGEYVLDACWSKDGSKIAVMQGVPGSETLTVFGADGSGGTVIARQ